MTQSGVSAFARLARRFALSAVLLFASAGALAAQTGKIEGKVRDQAGCADPERPGIHRGHRIQCTHERPGLLLHQQHASRHRRDPRRLHRLQEDRGRGHQDPRRADASRRTSSSSRPRSSLRTWSVSDRGNPLVPRDEVTTKQRIDGEFTENLPVDRVGQVLQLQPASSASPTGTSLSIRGGRADEAAVLRRRRIGPAGQPRQRLSSAAGTNASNVANDGCSSVRGVRA